MSFNTGYKVIFTFSKSNKTNELEINEQNNGTIFFKYYYSFFIVFFLSVDI